MAIIEQAADAPRQLTPMQISSEIHRLGLKTPSEVADMIRTDRDGR